jgi:hypothetical protein
MERPVTLAPATWSALERCARDDDVTIGQIIRDAIDRELYRRSRAKKAVRPDERLIAPLRALLADDFAYARSWSDLASRLGTKGLSYDFPRLHCDKGAAARHPKYAGQRRGTDREWVGRCGPCGSVIAPVFSHDLNG